MTVDALDAIRKLSLEERIRLVEQIWDSVADDPDAAALPITPAQREELDRRLADAEARPGEGATPSPSVTRELRRLIVRPAAEGDIVVVAAVGGAGGSG